MSRDTSSSSGEISGSCQIPIGVCSTPDFKDAFQDGWEKTVARMIEVLVDKPANAARRDITRVNVLPGCHMTPAISMSYALLSRIWASSLRSSPDLAGSLDGHIRTNSRRRRLADWCRRSRDNGLRGLDNCNWRANAPVCGNDGEKSGCSLPALRSSLRALSQ